MLGVLFVVGIVAAFCLGRVSTRPAGQRGIHEDEDGVYDNRPLTEWVRQTITGPWHGKNGGEAVTVELEFSDGRKQEIILASLSIAQSFRDALTRVLGVVGYEPPLLGPMQLASLRRDFERAYTGPSPFPRAVERARRCGGPPLCRDLYCGLPDGHE